MVGRATEEPSLFGDDQPTAPEPAVARPDPIAAWQIDLLRKALDARGLQSMSDRQQAIEAAVGRSVESLRVLTHDEALQVLSRLGGQPSARRAAGSRWDDREDDTWIDRL